MKILERLFPTLRIKRVLDQANRVILAQSELVTAQSEYIIKSESRTRESVIACAEKVKDEASVLENLASSQS